MGGARSGQGTGKDKDKENGMSAQLVYGISGMVCRHCETFVGEAIGALPGVLGVDVDAAEGCASVTAEGELDDAAVAAAVEELGYGCAGRRVS